MTAAGGCERTVPRNLHIIVTCSNRKRRAIAERLRFGDVPEGKSAVRCREWIQRLICHPTEHDLAAADLYAGEHWAIARSLPTLALSNEAARLWVCSAGYGLIPADASIHPYSATFATGERDSVRADPADWWQFMGEWDGPGGTHPRSISRLAESQPNALYLILLSFSYLAACQHDITDATKVLDDPGNLVLVSAGVGTSPLLRDVVIPADARLQSCFGGTRQSLNVRIGEHLLAAGIRHRDDAARHLSTLLDSQPRLSRYDRKKLADSEVRVHIGAALEHSPSASASQLLREFRDRGYACEQGRFGAIYKTVTGAAT